MIANPVPVPELPPATDVPVWVDAAVSISGHPDVFLCLCFTVSEDTVASAEHPGLMPGAM